jgi:hypothetical protein
MQIMSLCPMSQSKYQICKLLQILSVFQKLYSHLDTRVKQSVLYNVLEFRQLHTTDIVEASHSEANATQSALIMAAPTPIGSRAA